MPSTQLKIDTSIHLNHGVASGSSFQGNTSLSPPSSNLKVAPLRNRSASNASTTSSLSVVSPVTSSTNASTSSFHQSPTLLAQRLSTPSPTSAVDDAMPEYVLAMHDYTPQPDNSTCISFRAGQVIRVWNRDPSGWWDGELEGRRGWFPSNYVNTEITRREHERNGLPVRAIGHTRSASSTSSFMSSSSKDFKLHTRRPSIPEALGSDIDSYCPPIMVSLLHGLSLLQNAVRTNRVSHFQPSTACIISCVRSILSDTDTLARDAEPLRRNPILSQERGNILSVLAQLVAQAKKASEENIDDDTREFEIDTMLRLGGQVFAHVRRFLAVAVQCGVEIPERRKSIDSSGSTETENEFGREPRDRRFGGSSRSSVHEYTSIGQTPRGPRSRPVSKTPGTALRVKSMGDIRSRQKLQAQGAQPPLPVQATRSSPVMGLPASRQPNGTTSHRSTSSASSFSSVGSISTSATPPFPQGPCSLQVVMDTLRFTHDHYLSTIAAFIGHAHSHSRTSHASSTGHMYDLVREIVEMVCKLLTIVDSVTRHPDVPPHKTGSLKAAKENLYNVASNLAESVRLLTLPLPSNMTDEEEKARLLRSATSALKAGADCVTTIKMCLTRSVGDAPFVLNVPAVLIPSTPPLSPSAGTRPQLVRATSLGSLTPQKSPVEEDDVTIQAPAPTGLRVENASTSSFDSASSISKSSSHRSDETNPTSLESKAPPHLNLSHAPVERDLSSPISLVRTDEDGTTWEGSIRSQEAVEKFDPTALNRNLPELPDTFSLHPPEEFPPDPVGWMLSHDYPLDDVAYNSDGHLVGATLPVLVEKMTPHDSIVDPAFSAVFFMTFRLFSSPIELVDAIINRYNVIHPEGISPEDIQLWQQRKGIPIRLRVSNFLKTWVETYWRPAVDDCAIEILTEFTRDGLAVMFPKPAQRILELLDIRRRTSDVTISPKGDRTRDPGMSINPPTLVVAPSDVPRPTMTKTLLAALRARNFTSITITDFDALELARQLTIMECTLYCAILPEEILESGQEGAKPPPNVRSMSTLSTTITGWVAESILNEQDIKKRTSLVKFFIKVADRCTSIHNYSTSRSILAALDSSTISRLHQTWLGVPQKSKLQLEALRKLADHSRNYHEYRSKLRNTAPPAVPFLGLYLTDITFCREGNPSHRASPLNSEKKLINFNKYHKLARIVQDMQRFQVPYPLKCIPEAQEYLNYVFNDSRRNGDLQDLYRRSLLVEPKQAADTPPLGDVRQLFGWASRSQAQAQPALS